MFQTQQQCYNDNCLLKNNTQNNLNNLDKNLNTFNKVPNNYNKGSKNNYNKNPNNNNNNNTNHEDVYNTQHKDRIDSLFEACNNKNLNNTNFNNYYENKNNQNNNNTNNNNNYYNNINKNYNINNNNNNDCNNTNVIEDLCNKMYIRSDSNDDKYNKNSLYNNKNAIYNKNLYHNDTPANNDYINNSIYDNYDINNYKTNKNINNNNNNNNINNNNNNNNFRILNKPTVLNINKNLPPPTKPKPAKHPGARSRPIPEYLNFRKFSVPLLSPSPKVEVPTQSVDDTSKNEEMKRMKKRCGDEDGVDSSSVHQLLREGDEMSDYNLKRFRYTGRSNPSRVFMLLQNATGTTEENLNVSKPFSSRPPRNQEVVKNKNDPDDVVEMSYVGKNIPSRTFINLQNAVIERDPYGSMELLDSLNAPVNSSVKVVHLRNKSKNEIDENIL